MSLDFPSLLREVNAMPTVQAGLVTVLTRLRNAIELAAQADPPDGAYLRWLSMQLDAHGAELTDAVLHDTPGQGAHEERADMLRRLADYEDQNRGG